MLRRDLRPWLFCKTWLSRRLPTVLSVLPSLGSAPGYLKLQRKPLPDLCPPRTHPILWARSRREEVPLFVTCSSLDDVCVLMLRARVVLLSRGHRCSGFRSAFPGLPGKQSSTSRLFTPPAGVRRVEKISLLSRLATIWALSPDLSVVGVTTSLCAACKTVRPLQVKSGHPEASTNSRLFRELKVSRRFPVYTRHSGPCYRHKVYVIRQFVGILRPKRYRVCKCRCITVRTTIHINIRPAFLGIRL